MMLSFLGGLEKILIKKYLLRQEFKDTVHKNYKLLCYVSLIIGKFQNIVKKRRTKIATRVYFINKLVLIN